MKFKIFPTQWWETLSNIDDGELVIYENYVVIGNDSNDAMGKIDDVVYLKQTNDYGVLFVFSKNTHHLKNKNAFLESTKLYRDIFWYLSRNAAMWKSIYEKKVNRLFHNLKSLNTQNMQSIESAFPTKMFTWKINDFLKTGNDILTAKSSEVLLWIFKNYKNSCAIKHELLSYHTLERWQEVTLDLQIHEIHRVILNVLYAFFWEFTNKKIYIEHTASEAKILFDYQIFYVILFHFFDNAVKYCLDNTKINVSFWLWTDGDFEIRFTMISAEIHDDEIQNIFNEWVRWKAAAELSPNGNWIGMYYMSGLWKLINLRISIPPSRPHYTTEKNGCRYATNAFVFTFDKSCIESLWSQTD